MYPSSPHCCALLEKCSYIDSHKSSLFSSGSSGSQCMVHVSTCIFLMRKVSPNFQHHPPVFMQQSASYHTLNQFMRQYLLCALMQTCIISNYVLSQQILIYDMPYCKFSLGTWKQSLLMHQILMAEQCPQHHQHYIATSVYFVCMGIVTSAKFVLREDIWYRMYIFYYVP